jgi:hypothetical protein
MKYNILTISIFTALTLLLALTLLVSLLGSISAQKMQRQKEVKLHKTLQVKQEVADWT